MDHTKRVALKTLKHLTFCLSALAALSAPALALSTVKLGLPSPLKTVPTITLSGRQFKALSLTQSASLLEVNPGGTILLKGGRGLDGADGLAGILVPVPKTPKLPTLSAAKEFPVEEKYAAESMRILFDTGRAEKAFVVPSRLEAVLAD